MAGVRSTSTRRSTSTTSATIRPVVYTAPRGYALGVEVYPASELARRVEAVADRGPERVDLLCLLVVTTGRYGHEVDFVEHRCGPGSVLTVRPGQVHRFGPMRGWDGWFAVARPEHPVGTAAGPAPGHDRRSSVALAATTLPTHVRLGPADRTAVADALARMAADAARPDAPPRVDELLRLQLRAVIARLHLADPAAGRPLDPVLVERVQAFEAAVDHRLAECHAVGPLARQLGCSERTLARATLAVRGVTPKQLLTARLVVEAKRLLVHGDEPVAAIAQRLGFDEPTNFVKHFRRDTGTTPGAYRAAHR